MAGPATSTLPALGPEAFLARLREEGARRYHDHHPFHLLMHEGRLTRDQLQAWVLNRYYYQQAIPLKDAAILSHCPHPAVRRVWVQRILDHDGTATSEGGLEAWLRLADAVGLDREEVASCARVLPGVRFAVDAYVHFAQTHTWLEGVMASLTELFSPSLMHTRLQAWRTHYPWVRTEGLAYFIGRISRAQQDSEYALGLVVQHCTARDSQDRAVAALIFKCDVLWSLLDAVYDAHVLGRPRP